MIPNEHLLVSDTGLPVLIFAIELVGGGVCRYSVCKATRCPHCGHRYVPHCQDRCSVPPLCGILPTLLSKQCLCYYFLQFYLFFGCFAQYLLSVIVVDVLGREVFESFYFGEKFIGVVIDKNRLYDVMFVIATYSESEYFFVCGILGYVQGVMYCTFYRTLLFMWYNVLIFFFILKYLEIMNKFIFIDRIANIIP